MKDPICKPCPNRKSCKGLCPPLQWVNGNVERREPLLKYSLDKVKARDYKPLLHDLIRSRQVDRIEEIRGIQDVITRAIAGMLYALVSVDEIAGIMSVTRSAVYQRVRALDKEKAAG